MPGSSSWMPYAPQGVKEFDDDDDDDDISTVSALFFQVFITLLSIDVVRLWTEVFCIPITYNTCNFSVFNPVNKRDFYHFFCFVHNL